MVLIEMKMCYHTVLKVDIYSKQKCTLENRFAQGIVAKYI